MAQLIGSYRIEYRDGESWQETLVRQENGVAALSKALQLADSSEVAGKEVAWPRGDGYARYLVAKAEPLQLIHLAVGDAWKVEEALIRGLRLDDLEALIARREAIESIFAGTQGVPMDRGRAMELAKECLLIRAEQWHDMAENGAIQKEDLSGNSKGDCLNMSSMYKEAHDCLAGSSDEG